MILKKHFKNAGVPDIGFHGFRHTHASLLMNNDVNPKEIQARLGHADYSITMNTYSHLSESKEKDTAEKFGEILKALEISKNVTNCVVNEQTHLLNTLYAKGERLFII